MSEEKDDFLREIDELLGDVDGGSAPLDTPIANGSKLGEDIDLELADSLQVLSAQDNQKHQAIPKAG